MMEGLIFILLLTIGGSMAVGIFHHCEIEKCQSLMPAERMANLKRMPPNAEDMKELCPPLIELIDCYSEQLVKCTGQTLDELAAGDNETVSRMAGYLSNLMKLITDGCNEETQLHKNYVESVPCFREMIKNRDPTCRRDANRLYIAYRVVMTHPDEEGTFEEVKAESKCMIMAYEMACTLKKVEKICNDVARDVLLEVLKRIKFLKFGICSEGDLVTLKTKFVSFLEEQGEQDFLVSAFDVRRKK